MWCVVEGVSVMVNVVGSLQLLMSVWYGMMWCDKRKMDAAQIFDLGDGPSGWSG